MSSIMFVKNPLGVKVIVKFNEHLKHENKFCWPPPPPSCGLHLEQKAFCLKTTFGASPPVDGWTPKREQSHLTPKTPSCRTAGGDLAFETHSSLFLTPFVSCNSQNTGLKQELLPQLLALILGSGSSWIINVVLNLFLQSLMIALTLCNQKIQPSWHLPRSHEFQQIAWFAFSGAFLVWCREVLFMNLCYHVQFLLSVAECGPPVVLCWIFFLARGFVLGFTRQVHDLKNLPKFVHACQ